MILDWRAKTSKMYLKMARKNLQNLQNFRFDVIMKSSPI